MIRKFIVVGVLAMCGVAHGGVISFGVGYMVGSSANAKSSGGGGTAVGSGIAPCFINIANQSVGIFDLSVIGGITVVPFDKTSSVVTIFGRAGGEPMSEFRLAIKPADAMRVINQQIGECAANSAPAPSAAPVKGGK